MSGTLHIVEMGKYNTTDLQYDKMWKPYKFEEFKMTKQTETLGFDLATFKKQKEQLARVASGAVADKVVEVKALINEIKELVSVSGISVNLRRELDSAIESVDELHPDWNSSSYDC